MSERYENILAIPDLMCPGRKPIRIYLGETCYVQATPLTDLAEEMARMLLLFADQDDDGEDWDLWHLANKIRPILEGTP